MLRSMNFRGARCDEHPETAHGFDNDQWQFGPSIAGLLFSLSYKTQFP